MHVKVESAPTTDSNWLHLTVDPSPQWEEFEKWAKGFVQQYQLAIRDLHIGADRAQLHFSTQSQEFLLCYEWLSDACWIEPMSQHDDTGMQALYLMLNAES